MHRRRALLRRAPLLASGVLVAALAGTAEPLLGGRTTLGFEPRILSDLGIAVEAIGGASVGPEGRLRFDVSAAESHAGLVAARGDFEGFATARIRHAGGLRLRARAEEVLLAGLELSETATPGRLGIVDDRGRVWLQVARPHASWSADGSVLTLANADLLAAPALAALLERPELEGSFVGALDATLRFGVTDGGSGQGVGDCIADFGLPVDIELTVLDAATQAAREEDGRVSLAAAAELANNGPGDVAWNRSILPQAPVGPHPYLALGFYRLSGGVLEQVGRSDLKHAFFATNTGCPCAGGQVLYAGCEDQYGVVTNLNQFHLGPREELDALTRSWERVGSHFDATPVNDFRDHGGAVDHDAFEHRLVVQEPDLGTPGARYFVEAWYLAPDDADLLNSMGHREVTPTFSGSSWAFPNAGPMQLGSILDVWVDPAGPGPGAQSALVDTGQGRVQLAVSTTDLGGGVYRYEWALMNFDFEGQVRAFSVPLLPGMTVSNVAFGDGDDDPQNAWVAAVEPSRVVWQAPSGGALDWGRLHNFRMDVDAPPVASGALLSPLLAGSDLAAPTLAPAAAPAVVPALPAPLLALALAALCLLAAALAPVVRGRRGPKR